MLSPGMLRSVLRLLVTSIVVPSPPINFNLMMEVIHYSETLVLTRATHRNIQDDSIFHSNRRKILKCCIALTSSVM
jgi:hypothetical protein